MSDDCFGARFEILLDGMTLLRVSRFRHPQSLTLAISVITNNRPRRSNAGAVVTVGMEAASGSGRGIP
jgi:hypothetical protein